MTIFQKDIIDRISEKTGLKKKDVKAMLFAFKEVIYESVEEGCELFLKNVFTIKYGKAQGRTRYVPPLGKHIYVDEHTTLKIVPSQKLQEIIKEQESIY